MAKARTAVGLVG